MNESHQYSYGYATPSELQQHHRLPRWTWEFGSRITDFPLKSVKVSRVGYPDTIKCLKNNPKNLHTHFEGVLQQVGHLINEKTPLPAGRVGAVTEFELVHAVKVFHGGFANPVAECRICCKKNP